MRWYILANQQGFLNDLGKTSLIIEPADMFDWPKRSNMNQKRVTRSVREKIRLSNGM